MKEEEQKSSGIFLVAPGSIPQCYGHMCDSEEINIPDGFIFQPSTARFDLLIVGNASPDSGETHRSHWAFEGMEQTLTLESDEPITVAFDSYLSHQVQGPVELRLQNDGIPVFSLPKS